MIPLGLSPSVADALERFASVVRARFGDRVREVVLFGSHARGDAHEDSDVDVLVVIDDLSYRDRTAVFDLAYDVDASAQGQWVGLSPLVYATAQAEDLRSRERRLMRDVARDGVRL